MRKYIYGLLLLAAGVSSAEIFVPEGAVVRKKIQTDVPVVIAKIEVVKLEANLSATNAGYVVTMKITDVDGAVQQSVIRMSPDEAGRLMAASGYDLSNVVVSATAAIQAMVSRMFSPQ
jgi:hypothetical protein